MPLFCNYTHSVPSSGQLSDLWYIRNDDLDGIVVYVPVSNRDGSISEI